MRLLRRPVLFLGITLAVLLVAPLSVTHADTLTVTPPKIETFGNPGDVVTESIRVRNDGADSLNYKVGVDDFKASGDEGGIDLIDDPNAPSTSFSLAKWVTIEPTQFNIPAGQEKALKMTIRIPSNAEAGSHLASVQLRSATTALTGTSGAAVQSNLNSLVLLRVSGNLVEKLSVDAFHTDLGYYARGPVDFTLKTSNQGNVHLAPSGTITITDEFGTKVKELPLRTANVLPTSARAVKTTWEDSNRIGRYTATLVATYGQKKQPLTASVTFIIFPLWLAELLLAIILLLLISLTQRKRIRRIINKLTSD